MAVETSMSTKKAGVILLYFRREAEMKCAITNDPEYPEINI